MNEAMQNKSGIIRGVLTDIRSIATKTGRAFVLCKVGKQKCKFFGDLANLVLANQDEYEGQEMEARGYWEVRRENEFIIEGFGKQPVQAASVVRQKPVSDTRPEKPAVQVKDNCVVITIPQGVTQEQLTRVTEVANQALRGLGAEIGLFRKTMLVSSQENSRQP